MTLGAEGVDRIQCHTDSVKSPAVLLPCNYDIGGSQKFEIDLIRLR